MRYKEYFVKRVVPTFCMLVTILNVFIWFCGGVESGNRHYNLLLGPIIYGFISTVPMIVMYSKKELTLRQMIVRKIIHFLLVLSGNFGLAIYYKVIDSALVGITLFLGICIIFIIVNLVWFQVEKRTAKELTEALKKIDEE